MPHPSFGSTADYDTGGGIDMKLIDSAAAVSSQKIAQLYVSKDAVFTVLTGVYAGADEDLLSRYNFTGKTVGAGTMIRAREGNVIKAVTLTSGQVIAYY